MTYKSDSRETFETFDVTRAIQKASTSKSKKYLPSTMLSTGRKAAPTGKTYGERELPQAAALIFPALDALPEVEKQNRLSTSKGFIVDYYDRRAQAIFVSLPIFQSPLRGHSAASLLLTRSRTPTD